MALWLEAKFDIRAQEKADAEKYKLGKRLAEVEYASIDVNSDFDLFSDDEEETQSEKGIHLKIQKPVSMKVEPLQEIYGR